MKLTRQFLLQNCVRMTRKVITSALLLSPLMSSQAGAEFTTPSMPIQNIVFLNPGHATEAFWSQMIMAASVTATSLGMTLETVSANRNTDEFLRLGTKIMMRKNPPDLLITTNNHGLALPILATSDATGVPVMIILNSLTHEQLQDEGMVVGRHTYWLGNVSPNHQQGGHDTMQALIERHQILHGKAEGAVIALVGGQHDEASRLRLRGMQDALRQAPYLYRDRTFQANWSYEDAFRLVDRYVKHQDSTLPLRVVWAASDLMAIAAIDALKVNGLRPGKDVLVAGMGWTGQGINHLRTGELEASAGGDALAAAWSLVLLAALQRGVITSEALGTRYYTMGLATSAAPDSYLDEISMETLALKPMGHWVEKVANLPDSASPFLPLPAYQSSTAKTLEHKPLTSAMEGVQREK
ncbi:MULTISPECIES: ABC transporter substrate-binding protein [unclassified Cobetia]|uniref:ABC transporter substrate-binding protein n=1 Tax=unclassified Cobetia TaxID=2609414 RepID=UPI002096E8A3|nr:MULTISPECIES: ABC transporter substrate-binding protein [unclassified Cobetia]MCO7233136.1 ABC transporter substrate-binding protein [Cobetia sp. Dlab-2-AX]MCO7236410.1 ABC transporter substrate-binding protein [Cobetia sp. Dlab-2-U]